MRIKNKKLIFIFSLCQLFSVSVWAENQLDRPNILFVHHSVGHGIIRDGSVRRLLTEAGFDFWDHGYNHRDIGLSNEKGEPAGCYWIPDDNTNPDGLANLFNLNPNGKNAFNKIIENHHVNIFKSCFPANKIVRDNKLQDFKDPKRRSLYNYKRHYLTIRETVDQYPNKIFIIVTQPPLHPNSTNQAEADRARTFVDWIISEEYLEGRKNLFIFDLFGILADPKTGMLKREYQIDPNSKNSHPNPIANMFVGAKFVDFIINSSRNKPSVNPPKVIFDEPQWPSFLIRLNNPNKNLAGRIISDFPIKRLSWSDLNGGGGVLTPLINWTINDLQIGYGVTKIAVTAENDAGVRATSVIGLQYYPVCSKQEFIFNKSIKRGVLSGISVSKYSSIGHDLLVINGDGKRKRVAINNINLDISEFDPKKTYLEIQYDQGLGDTSPRLFLPGIGDLYLNTDGKKGYESIIIPFKKFTYVNNHLNRLIIRGEWANQTRVFIKSIKLICDGTRS